MADRGVAGELGHDDDQMRVWGTARAGAATVNLSWRSPGLRAQVSGASFRGVCGVWIGAGRAERRTVGLTRPECLIIPALSRAALASFLEVRISC